MKLMQSLRNAAAVAVLFTAGVANAAILQFNITGDYTASWQMDSATVPEEYFTELGSVFWDIPGTFSGATDGIVDIAFFNGGFGGGMSIYDIPSDTYLLIADGPQVYTGTEINPLFAPGTFTLTEYAGGTGLYVLTVAELAEAAVPEPATGAMLLGGLAVMVAARRRRRSQ